MQSLWNIVVLVACLTAGANCCRFNPTGQQNLDFDRYQGKWFLLETGPLGVNDSRPLDCVYESYNATQSPRVFHLDWHGQTSTGEVINDMGIVTLPDLGLSSTLNFFIDGTIIPSKVLATDYVNWAIEYACHDGLEFERFMLRGRYPSLNQVVQQTLHNVINSYGVNVGDFAVVNHGSCV